MRTSSELTTQEKFYREMRIKVMKKEIERMKRKVNQYKSEISNGKVRQERN